MKKTFYFQHDFHARHDPKLATMIKMFGIGSYGLYWNLIEMLHEQGGKIEKFDSLYEGIAMELKIKLTEFTEIMDYLIKDSKLFKEDDEFIWSNRVLKNIEEQNIKHSIKVEAGRLGGLKSGEKRSTPQADVEADEANPTKVKESKVKESKGNKKDLPSITPVGKATAKQTYLEYVQLSADEHSKLSDKLTLPRLNMYIEKLNNYIGSTGKQYKSHYHTLLTWVGKDKPERDDTKPRNDLDDYQRNIDARIKQGRIQ